MPPTSPEPSTKPGIFLPAHTTPNWLKKEDADAILAYAIANEGRFTDATLHREGKLHVDYAVRKAATLRDLGEFSRMLQDATLALKPELERQLRLPPFKVKHIECELASHGDGAHFNRHIDTFTGYGPLAGSRVATLVYYLNREPKAYSGGALRLYAINTAETKDVEPMHNLLLAFPSFAPHSVEPIHCPSGQFADRRFAVNIWIHRESA